MRDDTRADFVGRRVYERFGDGPPRAAPRDMSPKVKFGVIGGFIVLLAIGGVVAAKMEEKKVGDACETYRSSECGGKGGACLSSSSGNYCSIACGADSECPGGFACAPITSTSYKVDTSKGTTTEAAKESVKMCVKR